MMKRYCLCIVFCVLFFVSCGYHLSGGGFLVKNVQKVAVRIFENHSFQTGAENEFTNALIQEILQKSDTRVVDEENADTVIIASISEITFAKLSRTTSDSVLDRRVTARVNLKMVDKNKKPVFRLKNFSETEEYTSSSSNLTDEAGKREAVEEIAQRMAERIVSKMLDNF